MQPGTSPEAIDVLTIRIATAETGIAALAALLAPEERARAERYPALARRTFVRTRAALRVALGAALGQAPEAVALACGAHGKPALAHGGSPHFSVAHAGGLAAIALAPWSVGVDVEPLRAVADRDALAARFFLPDELAELRSLPAADRDLAFLRCWTRKEAYAKAADVGMPRALERCRVTLREGDAPRVVAIDGAAAGAAAWTLHDVDVAPGFVCALAHRGPPAAVRVAGERYMPV